EYFMVIDAILGILIVWGFYTGFTRGIIKTVFTIISYAFGVMAVIKFGRPATNFLREAFNSNEPLMFIPGYLLAFFLTMLLIRLIARTLEGFLQTANINIINQVAGGILFAVLNAFIYSAILWFLVQSSIVSTQATAESRSYVYLEKLPGQVRNTWEKLAPTFKQFWEKSLEDMDRLKEKMEVERTESEPVIRDIEEPSNGE
ncbi:MAG: CvpA family protein, partial [Bacteroidetes bacterium]